MSTHVFPLQKTLSMAFSRLQIWFDPAQTGSPYESLQPKKDKKAKKLEPFFTKRLSVRI